MSQPSSAQVKVSGSATTYTAATLDPELRSSINALLIKDGHIDKIQDIFLHTLNSNKDNWPTAIRTRALSLLRSGEVTTFPALIRRVLEDVRHDTDVAEGGGGSKKNGSESVNGSSTNGRSKVNGASSAVPEGSLAIPAAVVEELLKATRASLEEVCDFQEEKDS